MKHLKLFLLLFLIFILPLSSSAQWIQSLSVLPATPSSNDTLTILAECSFFAGGCSDHTKSYFISGNEIYAQALHCVGMLTVICNYTDTFTLPPLPPGNYTFYFQVDAGQGPSPCTPGIVAGNNDSLKFVVSPFTGIREFITQDEVYAFPNPTNDKFQVKGLEIKQFPINVELFSVEGKLIQKMLIQNPEEFLDISKLPAGIYQAIVQTSTHENILLQLVRY